MNAPELESLRHRREDIAARIAERLAVDAPLAELQEMRARQQLIDAVIVDAATPPSAWRGHLIALFAVGVAVSVAAWYPMPSVAFVLEVDASAVQMQMTGKGSLAGGAVDGELRAEGFSRLESADPALVKRAGGGAGQLDLVAERLALRRVAFPAGARVGFEGGQGAVRLTVDGAPQSVEIDLGGAVSSSFSGSPRETGRYDIGEWIRLTSDAAPTELWIARKPERSHAWQGLQPASLRFVERQAGADAQTRVVSSLRKAVLQVPETDGELKLAGGAGLEFDGLSVDRADLVVGDIVTLKVSGSARRAVVRTGGFERSLKPSVLEYAAHNHALGLLWSAAGLLWGISTWLRKLLPG